MRHSSFKVIPSLFSRIAFPPCRFILHVRRRSAPARSNYRSSAANTTHTHTHTQIVAACAENRLVSHCAQPPSLWEGQSCPWRFLPFSCFPSQSVTLLVTVTKPCISTFASMVTLVKQYSNGERTQQRKRDPETLNPALTRLRHQPQQIALFFA